MNKKEEYIESFIWCINDYLRNLNDKVSFGKITANDIVMVIGKISNLNLIITNYIKGDADYEATSTLFVAVQLKLNELLKEVY